MSVAFFVGVAANATLFLGLLYSLKQLSRLASVYLVTLSAPLDVIEACGLICPRPRSWERSPVSSYRGRTFEIIFQLAFVVVTEIVERNGFDGKRSHLENFVGVSGAEFSVRFHFQ